MQLLPVLYFLAFQIVQAPIPSVSFDTLKASPPAALAQTADVQELTVSWNAFVGPPDQLLSSDTTPIPVNGFAVAGRRVTAGPLQRERNPELSDDQLVAIGADQSGNAIFWSLIKDPRIVRAELPGADGVLTGRVFYRASVEFRLALPDLPQIIQVAIYQPRWTGTAWILDRIASFPVTAVR